MSWRPIKLWLGFWCNGRILLDWPNWFHRYRRAWFLLKNCSRKGVKSQRNFEFNVLLILRRYYTVVESLTKLILNIFGKCLAYSWCRALIIYKKGYQQLQDGGANGG